MPSKNTRRLFISHNCRSLHGLLSMQPTPIVITLLFLKHSRRNAEPRSSSEMQLHLVTVSYPIAVARSLHKLETQMRPDVSTRQKFHLCGRTTSKFSVRGWGQTEKRTRVRLLRLSSRHVAIAFSGVSVFPV